MKVTTILGSPKKNGNTAAVLGRFEALIAEQHEVDRINVTDYQVGGCLACQSCQRVLGEPGCAQKDDAAALLERVMAADAVVYATPLYDWGVTAQIKALLDRHYAMVKWAADGSVASALLKGKRVALLVTCAGPVEGNADLVQAMFDRTTNYLQCDMVGKVRGPLLHDAAAAWGACRQDCPGHGCRYLPHARGERVKGHCGNAGGTNNTPGSQK